MLQVFISHVPLHHLLNSWIQGNQWGTSKGCWTWISLWKKSFSKPFIEENKGPLVHFYCTPSTEVCCQEFKRFARKWDKVNPKIKGTELEKLRMWMKRDLRRAKCSAHGQWGKSKILKLSLEAPSLCVFRRFLTVRGKISQFSIHICSQIWGKTKQTLACFLFPSILNYTWCKLNLLFIIFF